MSSIEHAMHADRVSLVTKRESAAETVHVTGMVLNICFVEKMVAASARTRQLVPNVTCASHCFSISLLQGARKYLSASFCNLAALPC